MNIFTLGKLLRGIRERMNMTIRDMAYTVLIKLDQPGLSGQTFSVRRSVPSHRIVSTALT